MTEPLTLRAGLRFGAACVLALAAFASGCGARTELGVGRRDDALEPGESCTPAPAGPLTIPGTIRDLRADHPDFEEAYIGVDPGIVRTQLGMDGTPVYAGQAGNPSTSGEEAFASWFHDMPGTNLAQDFSFELTPAGTGVVSFDSDAFFPIDGQLFGDEGRGHNFHFAIESHTLFNYRGGETLVFQGDDDLWVFFDRRLTLDLGGVHSTETGVVQLDTFAPVLGLEVGETYRLDIFFAERHTSGSVFHLRLDGFDSCE